jgi:hypothetical protein
MKKIIAVSFLLFSIVLLASCSGQNTQVLDGEYYWINEYRNERVFTISGNKGVIDSGEADNFVINTQNETIELMGSQILNRTDSYTYKDGVFTTDISGVKHDYYKKDSKAYKKALKEYGHK